jgi:hypothetical protein
MYESQLEKYLVSVIKKEGGIAFKSNAAASSGWTDRIVVLPSGICFFVELKAKGMKPRPLQIKRHLQLVELGFKVFVIDDKESIHEMLKVIRQKG